MNYQESRQFRCPQNYSRGGWLPRPPWNKEISLHMAGCALMYPVPAGWNDTDLELDNPKANQNIFPGCALQAPSMSPVQDFKKLLRGVGIEAWANWLSTTSRTQKYSRGGGNLYLKQTSQGLEPDTRKIIKCIQLGKKFAKLPLTSNACYCWAWWAATELFQGWVTPPPPLE